jgi:hypothetical protein
VLVNLTRGEVASIHLASLAAHPDEAAVLAGVCGRALANDDEKRDDSLRDLMNDVPSVIELTGDEYQQVQWLRQLLARPK